MIRYLLVDWIWLAFAASINWECWCFSKVEICSVAHDEWWPGVPRPGFHRPASRRWACSLSAGGDFF
ncbi:hypothetical protein [Pseudomonas sp. NFIX28]|uniref:hypothetical protein n=1 Tax=Pseudomonas sp. NFIX28 TaxID=1566235 RepID=UPI001113E14C|nr:hypothetical protein [Pseudomonas sp. NFIX28]